MIEKYKEENIKRGTQWGRREIERESHRVRKERDREREREQQIIDKV